MVIEVYFTAPLCILGKLWEPNRMNLDPVLKLVNKGGGYRVPCSDFENGTFGTPVTRFQNFLRAFHPVPALPLALTLRLDLVLFPLRAFLSQSLELL